jgi:hypothetical protein
MKGIFYLKIILYVAASFIFTDYCKKNTRNLRTVAKKITGRNKFPGITNYIWVLVRYRM